MRWFVGHAAMHAVPRGPVALPPAPQHTGVAPEQSADVMHDKAFPVPQAAEVSQTFELVLPPSMRVTQHTLPVVHDDGQVPTAPPLPLLDPLELPLLEPLPEPLLEPPLLELLLEVPPELLLLEPLASGVLFVVSSPPQATNPLTPRATTNNPRMIFMAGTVLRLPTFAASLSRHEWPYRLAIGPPRPGVSRHKLGRFSTPRLGASGSEETGIRAGSSRRWAPTSSAERPNGSRQPLVSWPLRQERAPAGETPDARWRAARRSHRGPKTPSMRHDPQTRWDAPPRERAPLAKAKGAARPRRRATRRPRSARPARDAARRPP